MELIANIDGTLPMVYADISMIDRVIQNLVDNAIKYTPQDGWVKLDVSRTNGNVHVDIENSGAGITQEDLDLIFDRYYKVGKEQTGIEGAGLGLAIVKKILDLHQVAIHVESHLNDSTKFAFDLPVYQR